jgi:hypothetical protein
MDNDTSKWVGLVVWWFGQLDRKRVRLHSGQPQAFGMSHMLTMSWCRDFVKHIAGTIYHMMNNQQLNI